MVRSFMLLFMALSLGAATQPSAPALTARQHHDLRCAAAFAVVAGAQTRGDRAALALPPLGIRGKLYLGLVGERVAADTGLSGDAVRDLLSSAATAVAHDGAVAAATACLAELDVAVPPRPAPDAVACLALLGVYADVLNAREADSALGHRLATEAAALGPPAHALLASRGLNASGQAAAIAAARARVRHALTDEPGAIDADDYAQCRRRSTSAPG